MSDFARTSVIMLALFLSTCPSRDILRLIYPFHFRFVKLVITIHERLLDIEYISLIYNVYITDQAHCACVYDKFLCE